MITADEEERFLEHDTTLWVTLTDKKSCNHIVLRDGVYCKRVVVELEGVTNVAIAYVLVVILKEIG